MSAVCQRCTDGWPSLGNKAKYLFLTLRDCWRLRTAVPVPCILLLERS